MNAPIILFHLSDIHFSRWRVDGTTYDVDATLRDEIERSALDLFQERGPATGVVITGDIAYAADRREYEAAVAWLRVLCAKLGCAESDVWTTPGNHDVNRKTTDTRFTSMVQGDLRKDHASLAGLLSETQCAEALFEPLDAYNEFAAKYECEVGPKRLVWTKNLPLNDGSTLRLCGLNSTLTSSRHDAPDQKRLVLGDIAPFLKREDGVAYVALCHHPPDWLLDGDGVEDLLASRLHVQLFGHKHSARVRRIGDMVRVVAGATHPDREEASWEPRFNVLTFTVVGDGTARSLEMTVSAHVWKPTELKFAAEACHDSSGGPWRIKLAAWKPSVLSKPRPLGIPSVPAALDHSTEPKPMDEARRLTYRFLTLPHHKRLAVALKLGLLRDDDAGLKDAELFSRIFIRAREASQLRVLSDEIDAQHKATHPNTSPDGS